MFKEWGFLLAEIWVLLALAVLVGLIAGWLIWGGRSDTGTDADEMRRLRAELDREKARARSGLGGMDDDVPPMQGGGYQRPKPPSPALPVSPAPVAPTDDVMPPTPVAPPSLEDPVVEPADISAPAQTKPQGIEAARDGIPDDLTKIKGVGAKMEKLCNSLGYFHYDQIAAWTQSEVAWVDDNLEGFKGRVTRDNWVEQAKALANNETPAFVRRRD